MRLDKYVSTVTEYSRAQAKQLIRAGHVRLLGEKVFDPRVAVREDVVVELHGEQLRAALPRYFMMNKPAGYVSATKDRQHSTAIDLLNEDNRERFHIAGRLDIDTTGLLLITEDGQWSHRVTSPNGDCKKTYYIETFAPIDPMIIDLFKQGVKLDNELRLTKPAQLLIIDTHIAKLTISEGKYHQVKRMFASVGNKVDMLHRLSIGDIDLDENLQLGEYRALTSSEVNSI